MSPEDEQQQGCDDAKLRTGFLRRKRRQRKRNPDKEREYQRRFREKSREKIRARDKQRYAAATARGVVKARLIEPSTLSARARALRWSDGKRTVVAGLDMWGYLHMYGAEAARRIRTWERFADFESARGSGAEWLARHDRA